MELQEILKTCDHTLLRVDASSKEIMQLCDQAIKYRCASVSVSRPAMWPAPSAMSATG